MNYIMIRHKVADFAAWKPAYDAHASARENAGLKEEHLLRSIDNPNEVVCFFPPKIPTRRSSSPGRMICASGCSRRVLAISRTFIF